MTCAQTRKESTPVTFALASRNRRSIFRPHDPALTGTRLRDPGHPRTPNPVLCDSRAVEIADGATGKGCAREWRNLRFDWSTPRIDTILGYEIGCPSKLTDLEVELITGVVNDAEELLALAKDADALVVSSREAVPRDALDRLVKCQVVVRMSVGIDHVDLDAATDNGIIVSHCPDYCTAEVADHAMALIMALNRRIVETNEDLHNGAWVQRSYHTQEILRGPMQPLREQTLGIIGLGRIGQSVCATRDTVRCAHHRERSVPRPGGSGDARRRAGFAR